MSAAWLRVDVERSGGLALLPSAPALLNVAHIVAVVPLDASPLPTISMVGGAALRVLATFELVQAAIERGVDVVDITAAGQAKRREAAFKAACLQDFRTALTHSTGDATFGVQSGADVTIFVRDSLQMPQRFTGKRCPDDVWIYSDQPWYQRSVRVRFPERTYDLILPASVVFPAGADPTIG